MAVTLGIIIAFFLILTQSVWVFNWIFSSMVPVPYSAEVSIGAAAVVAGFGAGWMAHRYGISSWRVGVLVGLVPAAAIVIGTTVLGDLARIIRETSPGRYALFGGEIAVAVLACRMGAVLRAKVRGPGRLSAVR
jgi:hypothetical protein